jgi:PAS domain S-box-containing protein
MADPEDAPDVDFELKERAMDEAPVGITISDPDREDNPVIYANEAFERLTGYPRSEVLGRNCRFLQGEDSSPQAVQQMAAAIAAAEPVTVELVNYRVDGERFWNEVTIAPIRNAAGEVTNYVGFQNDVTARKEAELEVRRRKEDLEHLVQRINGLMKDVTETAMRSTSREEEVAAVTERFAAAEPYVFAWFGEPDLVSEALVPASWAGAGDPLDGLQIAVGADDPTARAYETRSIQTAAVMGTACDAHVASARTLAAIPVTYRDTIYGVVTVYTDETDVFDERETVVLEALGRTVGTAINARESHRILTADNVVELRFEIADPTLFLIELSHRCACRLEYQGSIRNGNATPSMFFSTTGARDAVLDAATDVAEIDEAIVISGDDSVNLVEFELAETSVVAELAERGVNTRAIVVDDGVAQFTLELPPATSARSIATLLRERFPDTELVASRERDRPATTKQEFVREVGETLTDRQFTALQKAYLSGYYAANRSTTGEELAESMDISRATFHQHLRAAEQKLLGEFFGVNT